MAKKSAKTPVDTSGMSEREKALEAYLQKNKDSIVRLGESARGASVPMRKTGVLAFDRLTGGLPAGRIVEIFGDASAGKTTLTLHFTAQCQADGLTVAFIDAEHALDLSYAEALGVNTGTLLLAQPACGEDALDIANDLAAGGLVDVIVVDSVAALTPRAELEGEMSDSHIGLQARMMGKGLRKLAGNVQVHGITAVFLNQLRNKVGVVFGNPETTPGGMALPFYASMRIQLKTSTQIKQGEQRVGNAVRLTVVKNKVGRPYVKDVLNIMYGAGFDNYNWVFDRGIDVGVIAKSGAWFSYMGERLGQGREASLTALRENQTLWDSVLRDVNELLDAVEVTGGGDDVDE